MQDIPANQNDPQDSSIQEPVTLNPSDDAFVIANGLSELGDKLLEGMKLMAAGWHAVAGGLNRHAAAFETEGEEPPAPSTYMDGSLIKS